MPPSSEERACRKVIDTLGRWCGVVNDAYAGGGIDTPTRQDLLRTILALGGPTDQPGWADRPDQDWAAKAEAACRAAGIFPRWTKKGLPPG